MDESIRQALKSDRTIDITTIGRQSGQPRRLEIWFHNLDGQIYITGTPGRRDWYANMRANAGFTFHLKSQVVADLRAQATPITDETERRVVFTEILGRLGHEKDLAEWVLRSPLVRVTFPED